MLFSFRPRRVPCMVIYKQISNRVLIQKINLLKETWTEKLIRSFSTATSTLSKDEVASTRIDYKVSNIDDASLPSKDPYKWFDFWFQDAVKHPQVVEANAMNLATSTKDGKVSARMVLLKGITEKGFRFFTNHESTKGKQLNENPYAALTFYWEPLGRQVRINGLVERISDEESTAYFLQRPFSSQIGALVSHQTTVIPDEGYLEQRRKELTEQYEGKIVPKPEYWGGYIVVPELIEFCCGGSGGYDRIQFRLPNNNEEIIDGKLIKQGDNGWLYERLSP